MTYTYDPVRKSGIDIVRLLISDTDMSNTTPAQPWENSAQFSDEELQIFLNFAPAGDPGYGAVNALRSWALYIISSSPNVSGDGAGADLIGQAEAMQKAADMLQAQIESMPAEAYAEVDWNQFAAERILYNTYMRLT